MFPLFILSRILFIACMVLIIGYVFGNFSKKESLRTLTKIASILVIVLFIAANAFRFGGWRNPATHQQYGCYYQQKDSLHMK